MKRIVAHLAGQGLKRIVHLAGPPNIFAAQERRAAFEHAARDLDLPGCRVIEGCLIQEDGRNVIRREYADAATRPEAFVAFNDSVALGVLTEIRRVSAAGRQIAVTGWDNTPAAEVLDLTSAEMRLTSLGETSARLLLDRMENPAKAKSRGRAVVLDMELRIRGSSQLVPSAGGASGR